MARQRKRPVRRRQRPDAHPSREARIEAILVRCRLDGNGKYVRYDDTDGLVITVSDATARDVYRYSFRSVDEALWASAERFRVRRYRSDA